MSKTFVSNTLTDPGLIALEERTEVLDGYNLPNPLYVSPDGSDETGDGTEQKPFRQIQYAIDLIPKSTPWGIVVDEGEYEFIRMIRKHIGLRPRGNIIIKDNIGLYSQSNLFFDPVSDNLNITLKITSYNFAIINIQQHSGFYTQNRQMSITFLNNSGLIPQNLISLIGSSVVNIYRDINYEGNTNINTVFYCVNSFFYSFGVGDYGTIKNITVNAEYFMLCDGGIAILRKGEINNKYKIGINCISGITHVSNDFVNNAQTPMVVSGGGRIFLPNSTNPNRDRSQQQIINLEDIEGTDLYNKIMAEYTNRNSPPFPHLVEFP